ncbi:MAG: hypothetical protein IKB42_00810 [Clostridia bacterium]|nr:hypothetical protein [Clostridia bacterium]
MKKKNWYLLDNAAKIFPCTSGKNRPNMFSVSAILVEDINQTILQETINLVLPRFPGYKVRLKKGLFWYYLEENNKPYEVTEMPAHLFDFNMLKRKNGYLFDLCYYKNKINLTMFHSLTDGTGAMEFLKTIVYQYLKLTGKKVESEGLIMMPEAPSVNNEVDDHFVTYYDKNKSNTPKENKAYHIEGTHFDYGVGVIVGTASVSKVKELAKKYNVTMTTYLSALFSYALYLDVFSPDKEFDKPIKLFIPVNMRKLLNDETTRNFACYLRLETFMKPNLTLEEVILDYDKQMKEKVDKDYLMGVSNSNVKMEKNIFMRMTPLFIKNIAMRIGYSMLGDSIQTVSVSNLGVVKIPKSMEKYIENLHFDLGASYNIVKNFGVCSYKDKLNMSFSRRIIETGVEKQFFKLLTDQGVDVEIQSNYWEK